MRGLPALRPHIRPGGSLLLAITGVAHVAGHPEIVGKGPLGAGPCWLFTYEGLIDLLQEAEYAVGHLERIGPTTDPPGTDKVFGDETGSPDAPADRLVHDGLIVAYPLPAPGLVFLQRRICELARRTQDALGEAEGLRRHLKQAEHRLEILAGREEALAKRIKDLRAQLLAAHAQMIEHDDEIHKTFGDLLGRYGALAAARRPGRRARRLGRRP